MPNSPVIPEKVHLVGSIGLEDVPTVLKTVGRLLGRRLKRVPDGEPGGRRQWIGWQYPVFLANVFLEARPSREGRAVTPYLPAVFAIAADVDSKTVAFGELGYAREARASYLDFLASRRKGENTREGALSGLLADAFCRFVRVLRGF